MVEQPDEYGPLNFKNPGFGLVALGALVFVAALAVGIEDNLPGIALLFGAIICWTLAVVRRWSRPKSFLWLALGAAVGFLVFAVLHNVFYGLGEMASDRPFLHGLCEVLHVGTFLLAVVVAPPVLVVGVIGWLVALWRQRQKDALAPENDKST